MRARGTPKDRPGCGKIVKMYASRSSIGKALKKQRQAGKWENRKRVRFQVDHWENIEKIVNKHEKTLKMH